ncbi:TPA: DUF695 domain-containing protein [Vibrio vulnificus]|uniref:DUF695 domain-containing protein n=1 Tax=Vibrio vulnificus TaxID=672 RepID=UPI0028C1D9C5|nr:DUF695 domain-containing protein [Vibrio vulnificus]HDY8021360.1 DUF695 domain-containing protein [Vibrio vulnificus]
MDDLIMIKRILAGLFATAVATAAPVEDRWSIGTAEDGGRQLIVRYRATIPDGVLPFVYPNMIAITWKFESKSGMPSPAEKELMNVLEDSISNIVEPQEQAFLTVVVTGNGVCEWQFYAKDHQEFMRLMNEALAGKPIFPIQVSLQKDPEWVGYHQFKGIE